MFVSVMDQTSVNLALPQIASHFDAPIPTVQWVTLGYMLTTSALLLPMGRLSDIIGRKRVYVAGFSIFALSAVLAGSSNALTGIIFFKAIQGIGAAMIQANGMAIVTSTFSGSERGKVIGLIMTTVGTGAIAGPMIGGLVVSLLGWRSVFFLGLPFGIVSIVAALIILEGKSKTDSSESGKRIRFDWLGAILSATALSVLLLVVTNAYRVGWLSPLTLGAFAVVAGLFVVFIWWESRVPEPMLALELFKRRLFSLGSAASFLVFMSGTSVFFLMPFYLQEVLGYTPGQTGLILGPTALCFAITGPIVGRLSDKYGWRRFVIGSLVIAGIGLFGLSTLSETTPLWLVMGALFTQGVGMGSFYTPNASAVLSTVEQSRYGVATAFMTLMRTGASVIGIALVTSVVTAIMASQGFEPSLDAVSSGGGEGVKAAFTQGLRTAYLGMSSLVVLALVLSSFKGGTPIQEDTSADVATRLPSKV